MFPSGDVTHPGVFPFKESMYQQHVGLGKVLHMHPVEVGRLVELEPPYSCWDDVPHEERG